jgi:CheY-like chemotaxis protein
MDADMYDHPAVAANVTILRERGATIVEPGYGRMASGLVGQGRLAEPPTIVDTLRIVLARKGDLAGWRVVVTAGGTQEAIDPVRYVSNRSSGKMGYALAENATRRGAAVTRRLLAFAREQPLEAAPVDLAVLLPDLAENMLSRTLGGTVRVATDVETGLWPVLADATELQVALLNLAINGRDAMPGGGVLTLSAENVRCGAAQGGAPGGLSPGEYVAVSVADTGNGMSEEVLARAFEPFFTTKEVGRGSGLGLSQVYGFSKQSGGDVEVRSEVGRGTTFTLYLPRVQGEAARQEGVGGRVQGDTGGGRRVLVVEDNLEVGRFSTQLLQDLGYQTSWAISADEALALLEHAAFDVVFSDVVMPGMSGVELGRRIRDRHPGLPVILTSGYSHVLAAEGHDGFELLQKPYPVEELSRVLQKVSVRRD